MKPRLSLSRAAWAGRPWRRLSRTERDAVEAEAESLPLPDVRGRIAVTRAD